MLLLLLLLLFVVVIIIIIIIFIIIIIINAEMVSQRTRNWLTRAVVCSIGPVTDG